MFLHDMTGMYSFNYVYTGILFPMITQTVSEIKVDMNNINLWAKMESEIFAFGCICRSKDLS